MARVTWDERKRQRVLAERELDLARAALILEEDPFVIEDTRHDYGERRFIAIGELKGERFTVVYTPRIDSKPGEDVVHIITAWRGGRKPRYRHPQRNL